MMNLKRHQHRTTHSSIIHEDISALKRHCLNMQMVENIQINEQYDVMEKIKYMWIMHCMLMSFLMAVRMFPSIIAYGRLQTEGVKQPPLAVKKPV